jgi:hypothetical protein
VALEPAGSLSAVKELTVDGGLTAKSVGDGTVTVKVTVNPSATLTVTTPIKFDQTASKIAGEFNGFSEDGNLPPVEGTAKVNGTTVKAGEKVVFVTAPAGLPGTLVAGTIYQISKTVDLTTASVDVVAGATLRILADGSLTTTGTISGAGTIIADGPVSAPGLPKLSTTKITISSTDYGPQPADLAATVSFTKDLGSGNITIKLAGSVTGGIASWAEGGLWAPKGDQATGKYSWVVLDGILPSDLKTSGSNIEIKQINDSLRYYATATPSGDLSVNPIETVPSIQPYIYLPTDGSSAYKWRKYSTGTPADTNTNGFGVLLWSETKTATLEIKAPVGATNTGDAPAKNYTVIVDWSGVEITAP